MKELASKNSVIVSFLREKSIDFDLMSPEGSFPVSVKVKKAIEPDTVIRKIVKYLKLQAGNYTTYTYGRNLVFRSGEEVTTIEVTAHRSDLSIKEHKQVSNKTKSPQWPRAFKGA